LSGAAVVGIVLSSAVGAALVVALAMGVSAKRRASRYHKVDNLVLTEYLEEGSGGEELLE